MNSKKKLSFSIVSAHLLQKKERRESEGEVILQVDKKSIISFLEELLEILNFNYNHLRVVRLKKGEDLSDRLSFQLHKNSKKLKAILHQFQREELLELFYHELPHLSDLIDEDADAIFSGDPAATTRQEVILTYPGFLAIEVHRLAHFFYLNEMKLVARILSEWAHKESGIDIHPGAEIGRRFCIDHGTGVVIGETTHVGDNVKIFQGVTLGALSVKKGLQNKKRHPTIESDSIIYANATILGGDTVIGKGSIIGGSVWVTKSVPAFSVVTNKSEINL